MAGENAFKRAKDLLLGAVDTVIQIAAQEKKGASTTNSLSTASIKPSSSIASKPSSSTASKPSSNSSIIAEHKHLFGFQPSQSTCKKHPIKGRSVKQKPGKKTYRKDCICLKDSQQSWKPSPEN